MKYLTRSVFVLGFLAVATPPSIRAADPVKPRVRAITGFITIDAKSYPSQIQETVTFLSTVRDAVKAAGYDVAGIRISTQPFPEYTRGLSRPDALAMLRRINDLAAQLRFSPNIGPAMVKDTDDTAGRSRHRHPVADRQPPQREHHCRGRRWDSLERGETGGTDHQSGRRTEPARPGQFQLRRHRDAQGLRSVLSGRVA